MLIMHAYLNSLFRKFHFSTEAVPNSLQTKKDLELVFRLQFLQNVLIKNVHL